MGEKSGRVFLVSGPSGSGKDTIMKSFFSSHPEVKFSISTITRPRRDKSDDEKYSFISKQEFEEKIKNDCFLEYAEYCGNYYGTPREPIERWTQEGKDVFVEVETVGASKIRERLQETVSIFIMPPSVEILRKRLTGRNTENAEQAEKRIKEAIREMKCAEKYDYVIINDRLEDAVAVFESIVTADRAKTSRNINIINEVLKNA